MAGSSPVGFPLLWLWNHGGGQNSREPSATASVRVKRKQMARLKWEQIKQDLSPERRITEVWAWPGKGQRQHEHPKGSIDGPKKKENGIKLVALGVVTFHGRTWPAFQTQRSPRSPFFLQFPAWSLHWPNPTRSPRAQHYINHGLTQSISLALGGREQMERSPRWAGRAKQEKCPWGGMANGPCGFEGIGEAGPVRPMALLIDHWDCNSRYQWMLGKSLKTRVSRGIPTQELPVFLGGAYCKAQITECLTEGKQSLLFASGLAFSPLPLPTCDSFVCTHTARKMLWGCLQQPTGHGSWFCSALGTLRSHLLDFILPRSRGCLCSYRLMPVLPVSGHWNE